MVVYLDHAATTPLRPEARDALARRDCDVVGNAVVDPRRGPGRAARARGRPRAARRRARLRSDRGRLHLRRHRVGEPRDQGPYWAAATPARPTGRTPDRRPRRRSTTPRSTRVDWLHAHEGADRRVGAGRRGRRALRPRRARGRRRRATRRCRRPRHCSRRTTRSARCSRVAAVAALRRGRRARCTSTRSARSATCRSSFRGFARVGIARRRPRRAQRLSPQARRTGRRRRARRRPRGDGRAAPPRRRPAARAPLRHAGCRRRGRVRRRRGARGRRARSRGRADRAPCATGSMAGCARRRPRGAHLAAPGASGCPANVHFVFPGRAGRLAALLLDAAGHRRVDRLGVPGGRAGAVARACSRWGGRRADARSALRFTLGRTTTDADVDAVLAALPAAYERARRAGMSVAARVR